MSKSTRRLDARALPCPGPVVATKKALEEGGFDCLEVVVGSPTAKENVTRFARYAGHSVEGVMEEGNVSTIRIRRNAGASAGAGAAFSM